MSSTYLLSVTPHVVQGTKYSGKVQKFVEVAYVVFKACFRPRESANSPTIITSSTYSRPGCFASGRMLSYVLS